MTQTRRHFLVTPAAIITFCHSWRSRMGTVHPVAHASIVLETPKGTIYVAPVGEAALHDVCG